jgi:hypothetical protein
VTATGDGAIVETTGVTTGVMIGVMTGVMIGGTIVEGRAGTMPRHHAPVVRTVGWMEVCAFPIVVGTRHPAAQGLGGVEIAPGGDGTKPLVVVAAGPRLSLRSTAKNGRKSRFGWIVIGTATTMRALS